MLSRSKVLLSTDVPWTTTGPSEDRAMRKVSNYGCLWLVVSVLSHLTSYIAAQATGKCFEPVHGQGCTSYIHMDSYQQYGVQGGSTTLAECAAAVKELTGSKDAEAATFSLKKADIATAQRTIAQVQKIQTLEALASCINSIVAKNAQNACAGNRIAQAQAPRPRLALEDTSQFTQTVQGTTNAAIRVTNILPVRTHALIPIIIS